MNTNSEVEKFRDSLETEAPRYGACLTTKTLERLSGYYQLLNAWNSRLHLIAPMSPQEFAVRHVLESLQLLEYLPERATIADIGSGAGLPSIPCLIVRPDIEVVLIEASRKKAVFLREALKQTATSKRVHIIAERFEKVDTPEVGFVTCRALERFAETVPALLHWAPANSTILLFGGKTLQRPIEESRLASTSVQMPNSRQRFLFVINKT